MRPIDAEELKRSIAVSALVEDQKTLEQIIDEQPTIERKKGRWTHEDCHAATYKYCCSECKAHHRALYDFCPSCGADMRCGDTE